MIRNVFAFLSRLFSLLWRDTQVKHSRELQPLTPIGQQPKPAKHPGRWSHMIRRSISGPRCRCNDVNGFCKRHRVYVRSGVPDRKRVFRVTSFFFTRKDYYACSSN